MSSITDVSGIKVGQAQDEDALTGVTVILVPEGAVAGIDVRGAAPGTRESDLLDPSSLVPFVNAIALCGGSAFGLAAASGVVNYLHERNYGFQTPQGRVPIVPAAVIYDLGVGQPDKYPDALMGYLACSVANSAVMEGNFGAGAGASVGKVLGPDFAMKSGVGTASAPLRLALPGGPRYEYTVGALVVTNAWGDIHRGEGVLAGAYHRLDGYFLGTMRLLREGRLAAPIPAPGTNTTLAVIATDAPLTKAAAHRLAMMAHDGMARAIQPAHTMFDGDLVYALSTGGLPPAPLVDPLLLTVLGALAADVLLQAIHRSVTETNAAGGLPALQSQT